MNTLHLSKFQIDLAKLGKTWGGGVVKWASLRCDMGGGGGASGLLFHVCIITLHGGPIRWANEFKNIS